MELHWRIRVFKRKQILSSLQRENDLWLHRRESQWVVKFNIIKAATRLLYLGNTGRMPFRWFIIVHIRGIRCSLQWIFFDNYIKRYLQVAMPCSSLRAWHLLEKELLVFDPARFQLFGSSFGSCGLPLRPNCKKKENIDYYYYEIIQRFGRLNLECGSWLPKWSLIDRLAYLFGAKVSITSLLFTDQCTIQSIVLFKLHGLHLLLDGVHFGFGFCFNSRNETETAAKLEKKTNKDLVIRNLNKIIIEWSSSSYL